MVYLKSGGRALLKFLAAETAKSKLKEKSENGLVNFLGSLAIDIAVGATEQADLRSWRTLPAQIQIARFELSAGAYDVSVAATDGGYRVPIRPTVVRPGKLTTFMVDDLR
jgi:hypothetical protein